MFHFRRDEFRRRNEAELSAFTACWERYYRAAIAISPIDRTLIDYESELNLEEALTENNVIRLLRWKDPRMLTHPKVDGQPNHRVKKVLAQLGAINQFRNGALDQGGFARTAVRIFPNGIVWQLFLFHIARPWEWPIADQHVFRAHAALFERPVPQTLTEFETYRTNFFRLAQALGEASEKTPLDVVRRSKRLDNALMLYGQFLRAYDR